MIHLCFSVLICIIVITYISKVFHNKTVHGQIFKCVGTIYHVLRILSCSAFELMEFDFRCKFYISIPFFKRMKTLIANNLKLILVYNYIPEGKHTC